MDLRRLRYFVQIIDSGSVTKAAVAAGVAQPALSQQLATLEAEMHARLVERSAAGVTATPAGRTLYAHARAILRQVDLMQADVREDTGRMAGTVAIGMPPSLSEQFAVTAIAHVAREYPELHIEVVESGPMFDVQLANGRLEIALSPRRPIFAAVVAEKLFDEQFVLVSPIEWDLPPVVSFQQAASYPWLMSPPGHSTRTSIDAGFAQAGVVPRIIADMDSKRTTLLTVEKKLGVALLTRATAAEALQRGTVRLSNIEDADISRPVFLCWLKKSELSSAVEFVLAHLRVAAKNL